MQKLKNNTYDAISALVYFLLSLWYSNEFYIDLKAISCRIEWSLFQVHRPKHVEVVILYWLVITSHYSDISASKG